jgi:hypothetical protein
MPTSNDRVDLTDLDVITRYSLAVRAATADRSELIAALRSDLDWLEAGRRSASRSSSTPSRSGPATKTAAKPAAKKAPAKAAGTATKKTTKKTPAKKTARR